MLADSSTNSLERVTIKSEFYMINGRDVCTAPLLAFLSRQTSLESLTMEGSALSEAQKSDIRQTMGETAPNCVVKL